MTCKTRADEPVQRKLQTRVLRELNICARMRDITSEAALAKFTELKPKDAIDEELAMSKVHISKNWRLPPRLKPGRRPQSKSNLQEKDWNDSPEKEGKKKKQNRDAQRAYRERRANRLREQETAVAELQKAVKSWRRKCKELELELGGVKAENSILRQQMETVKKSVCNMCYKDPCDCNSDTTTLFEGPLLQEMVNKFKPMKAVNLKKRKLNSGKSSESLRPERLGSVTSGGCGFCSDGTTCVCKDLDDDRATSASLGHCSNDKDKCENCADINESCLTTVPVTATRDQEKLRSWEPGSCSDCQADPASKVFCKSICNPAIMVAAVESQVKEGDCSCEGTAPGSCEQCQEDPQRREFCQAIFLNRLEASTATRNKGHLIPVSDAYRKIRNYMRTESCKDANASPLRLPMRQIAAGLRLRGREVESKSVDDALRDMDKNALG